MAAGKACRSIVEAAPSALVAQLAEFFDNRLSLGSRFARIAAAWFVAGAEIRGLPILRVCVGPEIVTADCGITAIAAADSGLACIAGSTTSCMQTRAIGR